MSALSQTFQVAIFDEFLDSFARIPRDAQRKVTAFLQKFKANPTSAAINYERIATFVDPNLRTVRVGLDYRAIVLKPEQGNVFVLLWVDHHDEAMAWARNKRVRIHPATGSLQVLTTAGPIVEAAPTVAPTAPPEAEPPPPPRPPLFAELTDAQLTTLGLPDEQLPLVRALRSEADLDAAQPHLPREAWEALFFLSAGESWQAVLESQQRAAKPVDTTDFETALRTDLSQQRFALVTDDQDLLAMLEAPLDRWRIFLHPTQRRLVRANFSGPARVLGGAGTGKTVVAMHRARHLASEVFTGDNDRILFTTFTHNLAQDIQSNLASLCPPDIRRRIFVVHLDKWVSDFLRNQGYHYQIAYWSTGGPLAELWQRAMAYAPSDLPQGFFREEWDHVVQPQGCTSWEAYKNANRAGRGVRLNRAQRQSAWRVFEAYQAALEGQRLRESVDAMRDASELLRTGRASTPYVAVLVDEAQDMSTVAFQLLRNMLPERPNDLFIVGDGHQRIYRRSVVLKQAGVNIVGRAHKLYINYRTTDEIRRFAVSKLRGVPMDDLDGGLDDQDRYKSLVHGKPPEVVMAASFEQELATITTFLQAADPDATCLVTRTHKDLERYEQALRQRGFDTYHIRRSTAEDASVPGVRLATMHRVKGLEFDRVIVAGCNDGVVPLRVGELCSDDPAVREDAEKRERALFYVAVTRARREVLVSGYGAASGWA